MIAKEKRASVYFDRNSLEFVGIGSDKLSQFKKAYPHLDIDAELRKMKLWLTSPKGMKRIGNLTFIINWLANAKPTKSIEETRCISDDSPLTNLLRDYLKDLWKDREYILEFNTTKQ